MNVTSFIKTCLEIPNDDNTVALKMRFQDDTDSDTKIKIQCDQGHIFSVVPSSLINQTAELIDYFNQVHIFYEQTCTFIALGLSEIDKVRLSDVEDKIDRTKRELKKASRKRIENGSNVKAELNYLELVRKIEKAGDCIFGVG